MRSRCCCSSGSRTVSGKRSRAPRGASEWGSGSPPVPGESDSSFVELVEALGDGRWTVRVEGEPEGELPLPPYVRETPADPERYQTVYARDPGSAAAPTAGLHFTPELLASIDHERITLHVGLDTFRPLTTDTVEDHAIHGERYRVEEGAWGRIAAAERVLAVGTTTTRVLETLARGGPLVGRTELFVDARLRLPACRRAPDELPPASLDAARARDGVRRDRRDAPAVRPRDPRALPLLLVRRRDARPLTTCPSWTCPRAWHACTPLALRRRRFQAVRGGVICPCGTRPRRTCPRAWHEAARAGPPSEAFDYRPRA